MVEASFFLKNFDFFFENTWWRSLIKVKNRFCARFFLVKNRFSFYFFIFFLLDDFVLFLRHNSVTVYFVKMFADSSFNSAYTQPMPCGHLPVSSDFTPTVHYTHVTYSRYGTHQPQYTFYPQQDQQGFIDDDYNSYDDTYSVNYDHNNDNGNGNDNNNNDNNDSAAYASTSSSSSSSSTSMAYIDDILDQPNVLADLLLQYESNNDLLLPLNQAAEEEEEAEIEEEDHVLLTPAFFDQLENAFNFDAIQGLFNSNSNSNSNLNTLYSYLPPFLTAH